MSVHRRVCVVVLFFLAALAGGPVAASASACGTSQLAAYDDTTAMLADGGASFVQQTQWIGQSFKVLDKGYVSSVSLFLGNLAPTTDSVTAQIRADAAGNLPGEVLGEISTTATNTSYAWVDFDFSALQVLLTANTPYWITATNMTEENGGGYAWENVFTSMYADGNGSISSNQGGTWTPLLNYDFGFRVTGDPCPAAAPPVPTGPVGAPPAPTTPLEKAPDTVIGLEKIKGRSAKFRFSSSEPGSRFECKLDKGSFEPCRSPKKYKNLSRGRHKFKVSAIDDRGNVDPSPAKVKFTI
jgi:hypothetical protein